MAHYKVRSSSNKNVFRIYGYGLMRRLVSIVFSLLAPVLSLAGSTGEPLPPDPQELKQRFNPSMKFMTEGTLGPNICFLFGGLLQSRQEIYGLKKEDTDAGAVFLLGEKKVTSFPEWIYLEVWLRQRSCSEGTDKKKRNEPVLSPEMVNQMQLELYWRSEGNLRPVEEVRFHGFETLPEVKSSALLSPGIDGTNWRGVIAVKCTGIPLTNSLVIVLRASDTAIAARTATRF
jgi:hypothetical protein